MSARTLHKLACDYARRRKLVRSSKASLLRAVSLYDAFIGCRSTTRHLKTALLDAWTESLGEQYARATIRTLRWHIEALWRDCECASPTRHKAPPRRSETDDGVYTPTPAEIAAAAQRVRSRWSARERRLRAPATFNEAWQPPVIESPQCGLKHDVDVA